METFSEPSELLAKSHIAYNAMITACGGLSTEDSKSFFDDLRARKGAINIEFRVNGFEMKLSVFMDAVEEAYDRNLEKKAAELIRARVGEMVERLGRIEDAIVEQFHDLAGVE